MPPGVAKNHRRGEIFPPDQHRVRSVACDGAATRFLMACSSCSVRKDTLSTHAGEERPPLHVTPRPPAIDSAWRRITHPRCGSRTSRAWSYCPAWLALLQRSRSSAALLQRIPTVATIPVCLGARLLDGRSTPQPRKRIVPPIHLRRAGVVPCPENVNSKRRRTMASTTQRSP